MDHLLASPEQNMRKRWILREALRMLIFSSSVSAYSDVCSYHVMGTQGKDLRRLRSTLGEPAVILSDGPEFT